MGKHSKNKIQKTFWIDKEFWEVFSKFLKSQNITLTDFILMTMIDAVEHEIENETAKGNNEKRKS